MDHGILTDTRTQRVFLLVRKLMLAKQSRTHDCSLTHLPHTLCEVLPVQCASDCPGARLVDSGNLLSIIGVRGSGGSQASPQGSFCPGALHRETALGRRALLLCLWHRDARGHWASGPGAAVADICSRSFHAFFVLQSSKTPRASSWPGC